MKILNAVYKHAINYYGIKSIAKEKSLDIT